MTEVDPGSSVAPRSGMRESAARVVAHATALARLQKELARAELERKGTTMGAGTALAVAAAIFTLFAIGFGLAALAAALALAVPWWLALLIVFGLLVLLVIGLALGARALYRESTPLRPDQAIEEARLTKETLRGARGV